MGCFSMNCSISGLGIDYGTPVRCLLLTRSPYGDDDPRKAWIIRTPPLRAKYNDYGSIMEVHPDDARIAELWLRGLREDVVEKGLGDNSCHDVPVSRDMTFEDMLRAIQGRRLEVIQDMKTFWTSPKRGVGDDPGSEWVPPLMKRVEAALEATQPGCVARNAEPVPSSACVARDAGEGKYVVDEPVPSMARVRFGRYEQGDYKAKLCEARTALEHAGYACVITAGTGRYANAADLLVFPRPREKGDEHVSGPMWDMRPGASASDDKTLRVGLAMIREDVWQALIKFPHNVHVSDQASKTLTYPHVPKKSAYGVYAWYDLFALKLSIRKAWTGLRRSLLREPVPEGEKDSTPEQEKRLDEFLVKTREAHGKKRAAMTDEERAAEDAAHVERNARWEAEEKRKKEQPFFGDFRITSGHHSVVHALPGAWMLTNSTPGVIGVGEHFSMLVCDKVEPWDGLLDGIAELAAVRLVMAGVGAVMRPAESTGPQSVEWDETMRYQQALLDVAVAAGKEGEYDKPAPASLAEIDHRPRCPHGHASTVGDECGECEAQGLPPTAKKATKKRLPAQKSTQKKPPAKTANAKKPAANTKKRSRR